MRRQCFSGDIGNEKLGDKNAAGVRVSASTQTHEDGHNPRVRALTRTQRLVRRIKARHTRVTKQRLNAVDMVSASHSGQTRARTRRTSGHLPLSGHTGIVLKQKLLALPLSRQLARRPHCFIDFTVQLVVGLD